MTDYTSNTDLPAAARWLLAGRSFVLLTHAKPDGDAWGSVVAMASALKNKGKTVTAAFAPPVPATLTQLPGHALTITLDAQTPLPEADRVVLLDSGAWSQCEPFAAYLQAHLDRTLILDHHQTGDIAAALRHVDPTAAATCQILAALLAQIGHEPSAIENLALYTGLATDTGFFRFSNTTPRALHLAGELIERGVDGAALYEQMEQSERKQKLALMGCALGSLRWIAEDQAAVMVLRAEDFARTAALEEETDRLVNLPLQVAACRVSALVCEKQTGRGVLCRVSMRSKASAPTLDVSRLLADFGGGGHARAAGARMAGDADAVTPRLVAALTEALNG